MYKFLIKNIKSINAHNILKNIFNYVLDVLVKKFLILLFEKKIFFFSKFFIKFLYYSSYTHTSKKVKYLFFNKVNKCTNKNINFHKKVHITSKAEKRKKLSKFNGKAEK